jgi:hypothetical protein
MAPARRAGSGLADSRWARKFRYSWVRWPPVVHSERKFQSHPTVPPGRLIELTNKLCIGSTKTSIEQRFNEHVKCLDGSPLHSAIQELGHQSFMIELVGKVPYIDEEQLLIAETANIIKFNSIEAGYNTKLSVS